MNFENGEETGKTFKIQQNPIIGMFVGTARLNHGDVCSYSMTQS